MKSLNIILEEFILFLYHEGQLYEIEDFLDKEYEFGNVGIEAQLSISTKELIDKFIKEVGD